MKTLSSNTQLAVASLLGLIILHGVQLAALLAQLELSPPMFVGPLLGASLAIQAVALLLLLCQHRSRLIWIAAVVLSAIPSVGPQKFFTEPEALVLSPLIVLGTLFAAILIYYGIAEGKQQKAVVLSKAV